MDMAMEKVMVHLNEGARKIRRNAGRFFVRNAFRGRLMDWMNAGGYASGMDKGGRPQKLQIPSGFENLSSNGGCGVALAIKNSADGALSGHEIIGGETFGGIGGSPAWREVRLHDLQVDRFDELRYFLSIKYSSRLANEGIIARRRDRSVIIAASKASTSDYYEDVAAFRRIALSAANGELTGREGALSRLMYYAYVALVFNLSEVSFEFYDYAMKEAMTRREYENSLECCIALSVMQKKPPEWGHASKRMHELALFLEREGALEYARIAIFHGARMAYKSGRFKDAISYSADYDAIVAKMHRKYRHIWGDSSVMTYMRGNVLVFDEIEPPKPLGAQQLEYSRNAANTYDMIMRARLGSSLELAAEIADSRHLGKQSFANFVPMHEAHRLLEHGEGERS